MAASELRGVAWRELTDQDEAGVRSHELIPGAVQLDRVRLAIDSAVVAQPDQRRRALAPEIAQADRVAVVIGEDRIYEGVGGRHLVKPTAILGA